METLPENIDVSSAALPASYEAAKTALANCSSIDECQEWANKAQALASYAKQADDDTLEKYAIRIRARAVRRCGELLKQFDGRGDHMKKEAAHPSQNDIAAQAGMSEHQTKQAVRVANVPEETFDAAVDGEQKTTITKLAEMGKKKINPYPEAAPAPKGFTRATQAIGTVNEFAKFCRNNDPIHVAGGVLEYEVSDLRSDITTIDNWLDRFVVNLKGAVS